MKGRPHCDLSLSTRSLWQTGSRIKLLILDQTQDIDMSDNDNDSVFDDDDFGNDISTVAKAPKVVMKKFSDIVDQIAPL